MRTLRLSLEEVDENGFYSSAKIVIPISGENTHVERILEMSYFKLCKDLEKLSWGKNFTQ